MGQVTTTGMAHHTHVFETTRHRNDAALRKRLFAEAHGDDPAQARAALETLARLYYGLRLPLVEARLNGKNGEIAALPAAARNDREER